MKKKKKFLIKFHYLNILFKIDSSSSLCTLADPVAVEALGFLPT
jgi:hypothetical protein